MTALKVSAIYVSTNAFFPVDWLFSMEVWPTTIHESPNTELAVPLEIETYLYNPELDEL